MVVTCKTWERWLFIKDGLLYHTERILGQNFSQLRLPKSRRTQVLELGHDTFGGHLAEKRTRKKGEGAYSSS